MQPLDAQQEHDLENLDRPLKLAPKSELEALLAENASSSSRGKLFDPIASAMEMNPKLTKETAEQMASDFGFL